MPGQWASQPLSLSWELLRLVQCSRQARLMGPHLDAGIRAVKLEELERRLRNDVMHESMQWESQVLLHRCALLAALLLSWGRLGLQGLMLQAEAPLQHVPGPETAASCAGSCSGGTAVQPLCPRG